MDKTVTTKKEGQRTTNEPDVSITHTSGVWKLDDSLWRVDTNFLNLLKGP